MHSDMFLWWVLLCFCFQNGFINTTNIYQKVWIVWRKKLKRSSLLMTRDRKTWVWSIDGLSPPWGIMLLLWHMLKRWEIFMTKSLHSLTIISNEETFLHSLEILKRPPQNRNKTLNKMFPRCYRVVQSHTGVLWECWLSALSVVSVYTKHWQKEADWLIIYTHTHDHTHMIIHTYTHDHTHIHMQRGQS